MHYRAPNQDEFESLERRTSAAPPAARWIRYSMEYVAQRGATQTSRVARCIDRYSMEYIAQRGAT